MARNNTLALSRKPQPYTRTLALVLLVLVGYGAIAGAAHSHGRAVKTLVRDTTATSISESNPGSSTSKKLLNNGECLVCQLHRNLHEALTTHALTSTPVAAHLSHKHATTVFYSMETGITHHGRAPPIIS